MDACLPAIWAYRSVFTTLADGLEWIINVLFLPLHIWLNPIRGTRKAGVPLKYFQVGRILQTLLRVLEGIHNLLSFLNIEVNTNRCSFQVKNC